MNDYQMKARNKRHFSQALFTPRNLKSQSSRDFDRQESLKSYNNQIDLRQTLLIYDRPTIKTNHNVKGNNFLKNIKNQLTTLKTQVDRVIQNGSQETTYSDLGILKNIKQSNSLNHSECSNDSQGSHPLRKQKFLKKQADQSNIMSNLVERKLKFYQEENEILTSQLKKIKDKYKVYKVEAENEIIILNKKLSEAEDTIISNQEELLVYKKEMEDQMNNIRKMLHITQGVKKQEISFSKALSVKSLQDQNSNLRRSLIQLKQALLQKEKVAIAQISKVDTITRENQKLKQQVERLNQQFEAQISNVTFFKSGESHINFEYSKSKINHDDSKIVFNLEDALMRKDSGSKYKNHLEIKYEQLKKESENILQENTKLNKEAEMMEKRLEEYHQTLCKIRKQKQQLLGKLRCFQDQIENNKNERVKTFILAETEDKINQTDQDQYIKQLQNRIQRLSSDHFEQVTKLRQQFSRSSVPSNQWINDDILREQDIQIQKLKRELSCNNGQMQSARASINKLYTELRSAKQQLQTANLRYTKEGEKSRSDMSIAKTNYQSEMRLLQTVNNDLMQKIKLVNEDKDKKDEFIKEYIVSKTEGNQNRFNVEKIFEEYKLRFSNNYLKDQIFKEARVMMELKQEFNAKG